MFPLQKSLFDGLEEPDPTLLDTFKLRPSTKRLMLKPKTVSAGTSVENATDQNESQEHDKENKDIHQTSMTSPERSEDSWYVCALTSCLVSLFKVGRKRGDSYRKNDEISR